jgi:hypothetical protein
MRERVVLPPQDGKTNQGCSDIGQNQQHLKKCACGDPGVLAGPDDVIDVIQGRCVEDEERGN